MSAKAPQRMPERYKNYRSIAPKAPPKPRCTCHPNYGASTCLIDHPKHVVTQPSYDEIPINSPAMFRWGMECLEAREILYRGGKNQMVVWVTHGCIYLQNIIFVRVTK